MNKKVILFLVILVCFVSIGSASKWISNSSIISGLPDVGYESAPAIYNDSGTWRMIVGVNANRFYGFDWNGTGWISNSSLINGLYLGPGWPNNAPGTLSFKPTIFDDNGTWKLITGREGGHLWGYYWNGTGWVNDSSIVNGIGYIGTYTAPTVYNDSGTFKLLVGDIDSNYYGFDWNGTSWNTDSSLTNGLYTVYRRFNPCIYNYLGTKRLIVGNTTGNFFGFDWNGTGWVDKPDIVNGLTGVQFHASPVVFYDSGKFKLITGEYYGTFLGFYLANSPNIPTNQTNLGNNLIDHTPTVTWTKGTDIDNDTVTTYVYTGTNATPSTFEGSTTLETFSLGTNTTFADGNTYYYRLKSYDGIFYSNYTIADEFRMNSKSTVPNIISESDYHNNESVTVQWLNSTDGEGDTTTYDIKVGTASGNNNILDESGLTNNISSSFNVLQFNTYYWSVRSNDSYELSDWSTEDSFAVTNAIPIISNVTLSPEPTAAEDDLTANNNTATDADGDSVTLYYRWYKNSILQSDLSTKIINSSNTSNGELWKVGIIPNDGYENGTEVQSQTVEIGSGNFAPTLTGVSIDKTIIKRYVNFTITGLNASDPNDDLCRIEVGSSTGAFDLGVSNYINASLANITIAMPYYDGLEHTLYVRLNDSNLTSQEYLVTVTSDITLPILNSESRSPATGTQGASFGITINTTSINSTIKTVTVSVSRPDATTANWSMSNTVNDTWYYSYTSTSDIGTYTINSYTITDASDNVNTTNSALSFTITAAVTTEGGGGGGGGTTIIQVGDISDLTITPPRLDTYVLYGGLGHDRMLKYRFITNREVASCMIEPNEEHSDIAMCEITDGYIVDVYLTINDSRGYSGTLTVRDSEEFVATSDLIVRVIDIGAHIKIVNIPVGEAIASSLNLFFASANGVLIGIRAWSVGATIGFLGLFLFKSDIFE